MPGTSPILVDLGIDVQATFVKEEAVSLIGASKLLRGRYGRPDHNSVLRWANEHRGYTCNGFRVVLPSIKLGGIRWTMPEWVRAFEAARTEVGTRRQPREKPIGPQPILRRIRLHAEAEARLFAKGVGVRPPTEQPAGLPVVGQSDAQRSV